MTDTVLILQNGTDLLACVNAGQLVISPGASPTRQAQNWLRPAHEMKSYYWKCLFTPSRGVQED